ncbi:cyclin-like protein [Nadsonia fulvescens var. elongata DSM 6958]|uniref:Cyclin-like protein n=1 Tax=Nadsonia fulvescens var. elongata DSM 6958 TaxID=857566 RepID=A0A1E3PK28_9ASCO|nr:cyclin-like protein [Nadsonia fulvescens var. elongata DSM 6958]
MTNSSTLRITDDDLYRHTSQYELWSFSSTALAATRMSANQEGLERAHQKFRSKNLDPSQCQGLTAKEEYLLILYYCTKCQDLASFFSMPSKVKATAIAFIKRFYLSNSVMDYNPKDILYTCLFLATKSENCFISIKKFSETIPKTTPDGILSLEYVILQGLKFTLAGYHPFNPLYGFFLDMQKILADDYDQAQFETLHSQATHFADESLFTDAAFLYTPPQIALACLFLADESATIKYLSVKMNANPNLLSTLNHIVRECKDLIATNEKPTVETVKVLAKRLHFCNPASHLLAKRKLERVDSSSSANRTEEATKRLKLENGDNVRASPIPAIQNLTTVIDQSDSSVNNSAVNTPQ